MPKTYLHHTDGTVTIEDDRIFEIVRSEHLDRLRSACTASILEVAPEHTQRNAALGIIPAQPVIDAITARRDQYHTLRAQIESVVWDGSESSRTICCDAIESIVWSEP